MSFTDEEIASNKPTSREEWERQMKGEKPRPTCICLREIENSQMRTQHCFIACDDQYEILWARKRLKNKGLQ